MSAHTVKIFHKGLEFTTHVEHGERVFAALAEAVPDIAAPCGGRGVCGKCRVRVAGEAGAFSAEELKHLSGSERASGVRLLCSMRALSDLRIETLDAAPGARIMTEGVTRDMALNPSVSIVPFTPAEPSFNDQRSDIERLCEKTGSVALDLDVMRILPDALREGHTFAALFTDACGRVHVTDVSARMKNLGIAVDIGTTTMAAYLVDLSNGELLETRSRLNPQRAHGADVINRVCFANNGSGRSRILQSLACDAITDMTGDMLSARGLNLNDIKHVVVVGNTIMMHLLGNLPTKYIAELPFIPVYTRSFNAAARDAGLFTLTRARVTFAPCVSSYVGADTVAAILACGMEDDQGVSMLIDIGTNGEIALSGKGRVLCCSAAAGPAFEGAHIRRGSGAITGAIDHVSFNSGSIEFSVIDGVAPEFICGSGIVDAAACLLLNGVIDETGRFDADNAPAEYAQFIFEMEGCPAFTLDRNFEKGVFLCQKDLREVQLAKAAIAAGIEVLIKELGISFAQVDRLYLAGGFGNYIDCNSAVAIGLLPAELSGRVIPVGNAAGVGARFMLMDRTAILRAEELRERMEYIELSAHKDFQELFVEKMLFER